jgi:hypothetical protein
MAAKEIKDDVKTIEITNFAAMLTRFRDGNLNSGYAKYSPTFGVNNFGNPGNLQFMEKAIDVTNVSPGIITDCIMDAKAQVEQGVIYVYAIGHTGRLYKIQVDNINTGNPALDTSTLLTTLTINSPTFNYGGSLEIVSSGSPGTIYVGHDLGVTQVNTDGTGETFVGTLGSWNHNVPRQGILYAGSYFYTNGNNLAKITSGSVATYAALSPGFQNNFQCVDIEVTADFSYIVIVASTNQKFSNFSIAPDTNNAAEGTTIIGYWNQQTTAITTATTIPSFVQTAYHTYGQSEYGFGYDLVGASVSNNVSSSGQKILTMLQVRSPAPNAVGSAGNLLGWTVPEWYNGFFCASLFLYGNLDAEVPTGLFRHMRMSSQLTAGDIINIPMNLLITNMTWAGASQGYAAPWAAFGRMYFSTIENNAASGMVYKLYTFYNVPVGTGTSQPGVYETQNQLFGQKVMVPEYRVYCEPNTSGNVQFKIDLIAIDGSVIPGSTQTFTIGSSDLYNFPPQMSPSSSIGVRITNIGTVTPVIHKIELDWTPAGI